jgi:hypothetical protein
LTIAKNFPKKNLWFFRHFWDFSHIFCEKKKFFFSVKISSLLSGYIFVQMFSTPTTAEEGIKAQKLLMKTQAEKLVLQKLAAKHTVVPEAEPIEDTDEGEQKEEPEEEISEEAPKQLERLCYEQIMADMRKEFVTQKQLTSVTKKLKKQIFEGLKCGPGPEGSDFEPDYEQKESRKKPKKTPQKQPKEIIPETPVVPFFPVVPIDGLSATETKLFDMVQALAKKTEARFNESIDVK